MSLNVAILNAGKSLGLTEAANHIADEAHAGRLDVPVALRLIKEIMALAEAKQSEAQHSGKAA